MDRGLNLFSRDPEDFETRFELESRGFRVVDESATRNPGSHFLVMERMVGCMKQFYAEAEPGSGVFVYNSTIFDFPRCSSVMSSPPNKRSSIF